MRARKVASIILAVLSVAALIVWLVSMSGEGRVLYVLGIVTFMAICVSCAVVAAHSTVSRKRNDTTDQPLVVRAVTSCTS